MLKLEIERHSNKPADSNVLLVVFWLLSPTSYRFRVVHIKSIWRLLQVATSNGKNNSFRNPDPDFVLVAFVHLSPIFSRFRVTHENLIERYRGASSGTKLFHMLTLFTYLQPIPSYSRFFTRFSREWRDLTHMIT